MTSFSLLNIKTDNKQNMRELYTMTKLSLTQEYKLVWKLFQVVHYFKRLTHKPFVLKKPRVQCKINKFKLFKTLL